VIFFSGVCNASWAVTLFRFVSNQMSRDRVVGREGTPDITVDFREDSRAGQSVRAQLGDGGGLETVVLRT